MKIATRTRKTALRAEALPSMNLRNLVVPIIVALIVACGSGYAENPPTRALHEQTHFSSEDVGVEKPIGIPKAALATLREDRSVLDALQSAELSSQKLPSAWFSVSGVHLGVAYERDLIVVGQGPLKGVNETTFWVFIPTSTGLKMALKVKAHDFVVMNTRVSGYRTIQTMRATAAQVTTITYQFMGDGYHTHSRGTRKIQ